MQALSYIALAAVRTISQFFRSRPSIQAGRMTQVLLCDPKSISFPGSDSAPEITCQKTKDALHLAANSITDRNVVVFPTETVYGLGANALDTDAAAKIFSTKGRPADNPLIVHVSSLSMLKAVLPKDYEISAVYRCLIDNFWPGALTLLFPADQDIVPSITTAGKSTVAVRMPSDPIARALIAISGAPLAAPSANSSGTPSPTRAEHVLADLGGKVDIILDGGPCKIGLESTVVDGLHPDGNLRVLRPGGVTVEDIENTLAKSSKGDHPSPRVLVHRRDYSDEALEQAPTTPGMKYRHYSPSIPVVLLMTRSPPSTGQSRTTFSQLLESLTDQYPRKPHPLKIGLLLTSDSPLASPRDPHWLFHPLGSQADPASSAARLFDGLLTLEREGADIILAEEIEETREGLAFMNRIRKAAGRTVWVDADESDVLEIESTPTPILNGT